MIATIRNPTECAAARERRPLRPVDDGRWSRRTIIRQRPGGRGIKSFEFNSNEAEIRESLPNVFPRLWRFCLFQTGRRDQADDLAQSTCLRALEKAHQYSAGTHLDRWLFLIAKRIWLNEVRATAVRSGRGLVAIEEMDIPDARADTETNVLAGQVLRAITELPEAMRVTVLMVYVERMSYREAADVLEIPIGTVMSRLATARKRIAATFSQEESQPCPDRVGHFPTKS